MKKFLFLMSLFSGSCSLVQAMETKKSFDDRQMELVRSLLKTLHPRNIGIDDIQNDTNQQEQQQEEQEEEHKQQEQQEYKQEEEYKQQEEQLTKDNNPINYCLQKNQQQKFKIVVPNVRFSNEGDRYRSYTVLGPDGFDKAVLVYSGKPPHITVKDKNNDYSQYEDAYTDEASLQGGISVGPQDLIVRLGKGWVGLELSGSASRYPKLLSKVHITLASGQRGAKFVNEMNRYMRNYGNNPVTLNILLNNLKNPVFRKKYPAIASMFAGWNAEKTIGFYNSIFNW